MYQKAFDGMKLFAKEAKKALPGTEQMPIGPLSQLIARSAIDEHIQSSIRLPQRIPSSTKAANIFYLLGPSFQSKPPNFVFDIKESADFFKSCHLMLTDVSQKSKHIDTYIDEIEVYTKSKSTGIEKLIIQTVSGKALQFKSSVLEPAEIEIVGKRVIIPLHLLGYPRAFPMISMASSSLHLRIKLQSEIEFTKASLIVCAVAVDPASRRCYCLPRLDHAVWYPHCQTVNTCLNYIDIDMLKYSDMTCIREIFVKIKTGKESLDPMDLLSDVAMESSTNAVKTANLFLNGRALYDDDIPIEYFRRTVTKELYKNIPNDTFVLPIDLTPLDDKSSSTLNLTRFDSVRLKMLLIPGHHEIDIFVRTFNVVGFENGDCALRYRIS